jgi:hypothetical protein
LPTDLLDALKKVEAVANVYATLGGLSMATESASTGAQFLLDLRKLNLLCALLATSLVHGAPSLLRSLASAFGQPSDEPKVSTLSRWSEPEFEVMQYDLAHLGVGNRLPHGLLLDGIHGCVEISGSHKNPYFEGGLLILSHALKSKVGIGPQEDVPIRQMNLSDFLFSDIPLFGGWCTQADPKFVTFVTFVPNFMKGIVDLEPALTSWAMQRLVWAPQLLQLIRDTGQSPPQHPVAA